MKPFITLYRKELKSISGLILILIALVISQQAFDFLIHFLSDKYQPIQVYRDNRIVHRLIGYYMFRFSYSMTEILAVIFTYLMIVEQKTKTHFQLLSLPVRSSKIIWAKLLTVVSVGLIISFFYNLLQPGMIFSLYLWIRGESITTVSPGSITTLSVDFEYILSTLFKILLRKSELNGQLRLLLFCSFIVISRAVMFTVNRYRIAIGIITFIGAFSLYMYFGRIIYNGFYIYQSYNFLTVISIMVLMTTGIILTEKYSEA